MDTSDHDSQSVYNTPTQSGHILPADRLAENTPLTTTSSSHKSDRSRWHRPSSLSQASAGANDSSIFGSADVRSEQRRSTLDLPVTFMGSSSNSTGLPALGPIPLVQGAQKRRDSWVEKDDDGFRLAPRHITRVEKDADDPTTPVTSSPRTGMTRQESTTLTTLSRLFAVKAPTSPEASRSTSYIQPIPPNPRYTRTLAGDIAALPDHLYNRGLLEGRHSDITINAFGHQYRLHRLILDRAPFFRSALSEPWLESKTHETTIHPEDIDGTITQASFELALKRLYGCSIPSEEDGDAVGLFATGCWLEMQDLVESSVESMLRQMTPETLSPLIKLVTSNYYGRSGDKILASAKAMLCRDGWNMPLKFWDGVPGDIIREIVGGDGFYIDSEWDRWMLAKRILDRRLKAGGREASLLESGSTRRVMKIPGSANYSAIRFDSATSRTDLSAHGIPDTLQKWIGIYTHSDIEPILILLDEGIHYIHLDFEQLQFIRNARDAFGLPVMPERVISNALWQQMELRQKVMNARDVEMELDISVKCTDDGISETNDDSTTNMASTESSSKGKQKAVDTSGSSEAAQVASGSWDGTGKPRKFWIPSSDCNIVMGGNAEPLVATSHNTTLQRHASRLSSTIQPEDVQWVSDFAAVTSQPRIPPFISEPRGQANDGGIGEVRYSHFPPFRFAAEFPNPRLLKERKRVYSRTVFYAGSLWNIYIQKVNSSKSKQLGVYLHRAKERETEEVIAGTAGLAQGSVDERIGQLEREMILGSEHRHRRRTTAGEGPDWDGPDSSGSSGEQESTPYEPISSAKPNSMRGLLSRTRRRKSMQTDAPSSLHPSASGNNNAAGCANDHLTPDSDFEDCDSDTALLPACAKRFHVPTIPPYVDARPTIKTYFKIYSPSRGGRMLSVYESAPDQFNFSQSWGWKSASLMLDESLLANEPPVADKDDGADGGIGNGSLSGGRNDGRLRFMVVIGNI